MEHFVPTTEGGGWRHNGTLSGEYHGGWGVVSKMEPGNQPQEMNMEGGAGA